jgi:gas vesicle protein
MDMADDRVPQDDPVGGGDFEAEGSTGAFVAGVVLGALLGAGVALMLAPDTGPHTRRKLGRRVRSFSDRAVEELDDATREKRRRLRRDVGRKRKRLERRFRDAISDRF